MKFINQTFSKVWIMVIILVIIGGGIVAWQYFRVAKEKVIEEAEGPRLEPPKETIEYEPVHWKTYRNDEYGYEIEYLTSWKLLTSGYIPGSDWMTIMPEETVIVKWAKENVPESWLKIRVLEKREVRTISGLIVYVARLEGFKLDSEDDIMFKEYQAKKLVFTFDDPQISFLQITYLIQKSETVYELTLKTPKLSEITNIFDQMLSTFRFLE